MANHLAARGAETYRHYFLAIVLGRVVLLTFG